MPIQREACIAFYDISNIVIDYFLIEVPCTMQVNFLSQIRLSKGGDGPKTAKRLMDVYFALFKV